MTPSMTHGPGDRAHDASAKGWRVMNPFKWLSDWFSRPSPEVLRLLARTSAAMQKRDAALARNDTRDLGRALMELRQLQIERLELGC